MDSLVQLVTQDPLDRKVLLVALDLQDSLDQLAELEALEQQVQVEGQDQQV